MITAVALPFVAGLLIRTYVIPQYDTWAQEGQVTLGAGVRGLFAIAEALGDDAHLPVRAILLFYGLWLGRLLIVRGIAPVQTNGG
ncbi:MAG: hypothetical protein E6Q88_07985 [Lysobacteraceae bacterium]|nr:MAG: hypothetical protein E6Q88_07985 [Xanthomonadaceae bacterium]